MNSVKKRAGRKPRPFRTEDNQTVDGLTRQPDGRWRIMATGQRFTEPDERLAVATYYRLTGQGSPRAKGYYTLHAGEEHWPEFDAASSAKLIAVDETSKWAEVGVPESLIWAIVRRELIERPKYVAERVGIEQLGYLTDLKPPDPAPTLAELRQLWEEHATCSNAEMKKVRKAFDTFTKESEAKDLSDISTELALGYRETLHASGYNGRTQKHFIDGIRRVLRFAQKERGKAPEQIKRALTYLEILRPSEGSKTLDPKPIEVDDWQKLYETAEGDDIALILLMLNGSFYLGEVIALEWADIKSGCIITNRKKTGQNIRVCALWPETIKALGNLQRRHDEDKLFFSYAGLPLKVCGAFRRFQKLAERAQVSVTPSQLRDGAYTTAVESGVSFQFCQLLNGHSTGMADHYVKRNPSMVKPACDAVRARYLVVKADTSVAVA